MNKEAAKVFSRIILSDKTIRIKLLGDSITHGAGGTGFDEDGEHIIGHYYRNTKGFCWANLLKEYLESRFDCCVINNGCSGTGIDFTLENFDTLVDAEDDIVLCTICTNDRYRYFSEMPDLDARTHMQNLYAKISILYQKLREMNTQVIFVVNIPVGAANESINGESGYRRLLHMPDIHDLYVKLSLDHGFPLIDLYTLFQEYCEYRDLSLDSMLADGIHPNDAGYEVIYRLLLKELGIARSMV